MGLKALIADAQYIANTDVTDANLSMVGNVLHVEKCDLARVGAPIVTNDIDSDWVVGSRMIRPETQSIYTLIDSTAGAAIWRAHVTWPVTSTVTIGAKTEDATWWMHNDRGIETGACNVFLGEGAGNIGGMQWGWAGTLTTRTSDISGIVTFPGSHGILNIGLSAEMTWLDGVGDRVGMTVTAVDESTCTLTGGSGPILPDQGSAVRVGHAHQNPAYMVAVGTDSLAHITRGMANTMGGWKSGHEITEGYRNSGWGNSVLAYATTAYYCDAFGYASMVSMTTGSFNCGFGANTLYFGTTAFYCTAVGTDALQWCATGSNTVAVGTLAGNSMGSGSGNTYVGTYTGGGNVYPTVEGFEITGNTHVGCQAGSSHQTGDYNIFIGFQAGDNVTGENNLCLGNWAHTPETTTDDWLNFDYTLVGNRASRKFKIPYNLLLGMPRFGIGMEETVDPVCALEVQSAATNETACWIHGGSAIADHLASGDLLLGGSAAYQGRLTLDGVTGYLYVDNTWASVDSFTAFRMWANGIPYTDMALGVDTTTATSVLRPFVASDVGYTMTITGGAGWAEQTVTIDSVLAGVATFSASLATAYTDLVIDAVDNTIVTSVLHPFVAGDVGLTLSVTGGTGFTVQSVTISSVLAGAATCSAAMGTVGSTGGIAHFTGLTSGAGAINKYLYPMIFNGTGYVGINTGLVAPKGNLEVAGLTVLSQATSSHYLRFYDTTAASNEWAIYSGAAGDLRFWKYTATEGDVLIMEPDGDVYVTAGHKFGVGLTPVYAGDIYAITSASSGLRVAGGCTIAGGASTASGEILLGNVAAYQGVLSYDAAVGNLYLRNTYDSATVGIYLQTRTAGTPVSALTLVGTSVGFNIAAPTSRFHVAAANVTAAAWTTTGRGFNFEAATYTDNTTPSGTVAIRTAHSFGAPTFASSNAITVTDGFSLYVPKVIAGNNTAITRPNSAWFEGPIAAGGAWFLGETTDDISAGAVAVNFAVNNKHLIVMDEAATITLTPPGGPANCQVKLNYTGANEPTFSPTPKWSGGTTPTWTKTNGKTDLALFYWDGAAWWGAALLNFTT